MQALELDTYCPNAIKGKFCIIYLVNEANYYQPDKPLALSPSGVKDTLGVQWRNVSSKSKGPRPKGARKGPTTHSFVCFSALLCLKAPSQGSPRNYFARARVSPLRQCRGS